MFQEWIMTQQNMYNTQIELTLLQHISHDDTNRRLCGSFIWTPQHDTLSK